MNDIFKNFVDELKSTLRQEILEELRLELPRLLYSINSDNNDSSEKDFIGIDVACELLNLKKSTVYSKVSRGELPVVKRSKPLCFSKNQLIEYLNSGGRKTEAEIYLEAEKGVILSYRRSKR
jgi:excisionase family DNA binding protein